jgi:hypothetical protein
MGFFLMPQGTTQRSGKPPKQPWPPQWAQRFADGGALRSIFAKPNGPHSNPLTDIRGNGGHFVIRSMAPLHPAVVIPGNTLVLQSVAGIASTVYFHGAETLPLFDPQGNS